MLRAAQGASREPTQASSTYWREATVGPVFALRLLFEFTGRYLVHPEPHRADEPLELRWFPREVVPNECDLRNHSFPAFPSGLAGLENFEHFCLGLCSVIYRG